MLRLQRHNEKFGWNILTFLNNASNMQLLCNYRVSVSDIWRKIYILDTAMPMIYFLLSFVIY